jgi:transposase
MVISMSEQAVSWQQRLTDTIRKRLLLFGKSCCQAAPAFDVARQTVYIWKHLLDEGGIDALRAVPEPGRAARLDIAQLASVRSAIAQSPPRTALPSSCGHLDA